MTEGKRITIRLSDVAVDKIESKKKGKEAFGTTANRIVETALVLNAKETTLIERMLTKEGILYASLEDGLITLAHEIIYNNGGKRRDNVKKSMGRPKRQLPNLQKPVNRIIEPLKTMFNGGTLICPVDGERKHLANCEVCRLKAHEYWEECQKMRQVTNIICQ